MITARIADGLTVGRAFIGALTAVALGQRRVDLAIMLLCLAWIADTADGRLARRASQATRFGSWDMPMDTLVGAGAVVGLALGSYLATWIAAVLLVGLGGGFVVMGNPALSMILQAFGYGGVMWLALQEDATLLWLPVVTIALLLAFDYERFAYRTLPMFFRGVAALFGRR